MKRIRNVRFYRYDKWRMEMNGGKSCDSPCAISVYLSGSRSPAGINALREPRFLHPDEKLQKIVFTYSIGILYNRSKEEKQMTHNYDVKLTVVSSQCPKYKAGDVVRFEGAFINKEESAALCMVALNAVYPFVYAARRGGDVKDGLIQCPDCSECVTFRVERA